MAAHRCTRRHGTLRAGPLLLLALTAAALGGGCWDRRGDPLASAESSARSESGASPTEEAPADPAAVEDFCAKAAELDRAASSSTAGGSDATAELRTGFDELVAVAPQEVRKDLEVLREAVDSMGEPAQQGASSSPGDALDEVVSTIMSPEVVAAGAHLQSYLSETCGIDLSSPQALGLGGDLPTDPGGGVDDPSGTTVPGGTTDPAGAGTDIGLEDLDAVEEAHLGRAWVDKVYSTSIVNDREIQLIASDGNDPFGEPLTEKEAVEACDAVRTALEGRQPALSIEVLNGPTVIVRGAAGVPCAPV